MANYKQTNISGSSWIRCQTVVITNPLPGHGGIDILAGANAGPTAKFYEEKVVAMEGLDTLLPAGSCQKTFNPTDSFVLLNPDTGLPLGSSMTHGELYVALYSLYMQTAAERDAQSGNV